jgi:hypothetical protein
VGASWVREHILDAHQKARLHVIVVWEPMYPGDTRQDAVDNEVFDDPRVTSFWDPTEISGKWIGQRDGDGSIVWDAFFAYKPSAQWPGRPAEIVAAGAPIIGNVEALQREFVPLLREG